MRNSLLNDWFGKIHAILVKGIKKNQVPDMTKIKLLKRFFDSVAALMTQNLQDICIRSLESYVNFMCDIGVNRTAKILYTIYC